MNIRQIIGSEIIQTATNNPLTCFPMSHTALLFLKYLNYILFTCKIHLLIEICCIYNMKQFITGSLAIAHPKCKQIPTHCHESTARNNIVCLPTLRQSKHRRLKLLPLSESVWCMRFHSVTSARWKSFTLVFSSAKACSIWFMLGEVASQSTTREGCWTKQLYDTSAFYRA